MSGYFAAGIWHPKSGVNTGSLWRSAVQFGAAYVFTVGRRYRQQSSDTIGTPGRVPLMHFADLADLHAHLPYGCPLVGVETGGEPLAGFAHPPRACYLLGAEDHGLSPAVLERCHRVVMVESLGHESMNVACAGSVVLHDRLVKRLTAGAVA